MTQTKTSFCRICSPLCGMEVTVDDAGRILAIRPDRGHPRTEGYACVKGLQAVASHNSSTRLLHPLKRMPDGSFRRIGLEAALDEIAENLTLLRAEHGPESIATFGGTAAYYNPAMKAMLPAWGAALGSPCQFTTSTIDQSAKWLTPARMGGWGAGPQHFLEADVWMFIGANPLVSHGAWGVPFNHPVRTYKEAKARGMKIIVVDPRYTETARYAEIFLQPRPGEDATLLGGLLRIILSEGWEDREFCSDHIADIDRFRQALEPFTPAYVEARAGVPQHLLRAAAETFAKGCRGSAVSGTGPDMAPRGNLSEHLIGCLNAVCGRYRRAGDNVWNPGAMTARRPLRAEVIPQSKPWENGHKSRIRGYGVMAGEMMTGILADEILTPGRGQIKAMIVDGGNPAKVIPDQRKVVRALKSLSMLVTIDPWMTETAKLSHFILPPLAMYERPDIPPFPFDRGQFLLPFMQYTEAVAKPPPGSEVAHDTYYFWSLAKRLGLQIVYDGVPLNMTTPPSADELIGILLRKAQVPLDEVKKHPSGGIFELEPQLVEPPSEGAQAKFTLLPADVENVLIEISREPFDREGVLREVFTHRLAVRRVREINNTSSLDLPEIRRRVPNNPAHVNPEDLAAQGLRSGDKVDLVSDHGRISVTVEADPTVRTGVVSMCFGFGRLPDEPADFEKAGACPNLLISTDRDYEPLNGMPRMSAIPVRIERSA